VTLNGHQCPYIVGQRGQEVPTHGNGKCGSNCVNQDFGDGTAAREDSPGVLADNNPAIVF